MQLEQITGFPAFLESQVSEGLAARLTQISRLRLCFHMKMSHRVDVLCSSFGPVVKHASRCCLIVLSAFLKY